MDVTRGTEKLHLNRLGVDVADVSYSPEELPGISFEEAASYR